MSISALEITF